jgi:hypothetical protein
MSNYNDFVEGLDKLLFDISESFNKYEKGSSIATQFISSITELTSEDIRSRRSKLIKMEDTIYRMFSNDNIDTTRQVVMDLFFRLTNYNNGSMVPLIDLVDKEMVYHLIDDNINTVKKFRVFLQAMYVIEHILYALQLRKVSLPAPYHSNLKVLERTDELYQTLLDLEDSFKTLGKID